MHKALLKKVELNFNCFNLEIFELLDLKDFDNLILAIE